MARIGSFTATLALAALVCAGCNGNSPGRSFAAEVLAGGTRISEPSDEGVEPVLSRFERSVAFTALSALGGSDVAVNDLANNVTFVVSKGIGFANGMRVAVPANGDSFAPAISDDGNTVAFLSDATNLTEFGTLPYVHAYVYDRRSGTTTLASRNDVGEEALGDALDVALSGDGSTVAFSTDAANLGGLPGLGYSHVYVYDRQSQLVTRVDRMPDGTAALGDARAPALSTSGRFVVFESDAALLPSDTNGLRDVYLFDRAAGSYQRISITSDGGDLTGSSGEPAVSAQAGRIAFLSFADGALQVYLRDRVAGTLTRVSQSAGGVAANGDCRNPVVSADGRYVAFESDATNLAPDANGVTDIFVYEVDTKQIVRLLGAGNVQPNGASTHPSLSGNGRIVAYSSAADNLTAGDANQGRDIFLFPNPLFK